MLQRREKQLRIATIDANYVQMQAMLLHAQQWKLDYLPIPVSSIASELLVR
jgi:hypothetical protein